MTVCLLLLALPLAAQQLTYDTSIRLEMNDGRAESVALALAPTAEVIVEFRDAPLARLAARSSSASAAAYRPTFERFRADIASVKEAEVRWEYFKTFNGVSLTVPRSALAAIRALPYVKAVHPDVTVHALADVAVPPANVQQVKADAFWTTFGTKGAGVVVAIIDTGIDYTHPALGGCLGAGCRVIGGYDFVNKDNNPMDDHFHGTHVAGIVAANSPQLVGVAPEASLIAFKVLNAGGSGSESDIVAAIERTVDPNGDGDMSDRVDVANLSLGGGGNPDDPMSTAIDNASALGVIFAVAAGNSGGGHSIGSPGTARSAITVGAVDGLDAVAGFSSRGPNMKDLAVKPEVSAPGVGILSSVPNGGLGAVSGTSMATPHVAGVAALLRAAHHDWTPAQVKAALIATAKDIGVEVMASGGGRVDALAAGGAMIVADPPALSFGLDSPSLTTWSESRQMRLTNRGAATASLRLSSVTKLGQTVTFEPATLTLAPGEARDVTVGVYIANTTVVTGAATFSGGGQIVIANGAAQTHVPWGFTKAARATIKYDRGHASALWFAPQLFLVASPLSDVTSEALLKPGTYDYFIYSLSVDETTNGVSDARVIYREQQAIEGDVALDVSGDTASHLITFAGRDENGVTLSSKPNFYLSSGRLFLHPDWKVVSLHLPTLPVASMHVSDLSLPKLAITEALYDVPESHLVIVNHPLVTAPSGDATLTSGGADLATAKVRLFLPPGLAPSMALTTVPLLNNAGDEPGTGVRVVARNPGSAEMTWRLAMNAPSAAGYGTAVSFSAPSDALPWYTSPRLVCDSGKIVVKSAPATPPVPYDDGAFAFGFGPILLFSRLAPVRVGTAPPAFSTVTTSLFGQSGESRGRDVAASTVTLSSADGKTIYAVNPTQNALRVDTGNGAAYRIDVVAPGLLFGGVPRTATLTMTFDSARSDLTPPTFTSVVLRDAHGHITRSLEPNGGGALQFAVADYPDGITAAKSYQPVRGEATKVFYRLHGATDWLPLSAFQISEDSGAAGVAGGITYGADLSLVTRVSRALVDVRIDAADAAGNTASIVYEPAFAVGTEVPPRGRAAGR